MISDNEPPQSDRYDAEFAQVAKRYTQQMRKKKKDLTARISADLHNNLMAFALEEVVDVDSVVEEAIANYLPSRSTESKAEVRALEESATPSYPALNYRQDLARIYEAARHQIWMVRRKIEEWKGDRFCEAFFEVKQLREQIRKEGDRDA